MIYTRYNIFLMIVFFMALSAKVPFSTLYLEITKTRFEGDKELLKNEKDAEKNSDKLDKMTTYQKIWVDVPNNSYLVIEEPGKDNKYMDKTGRLKFKDVHYSLDFSAKVALDETSINKIYDNYTSEEPDYKYYQAVLLGKRAFRMPNGDRKRVNHYRYSYADPFESEQIDALIAELKSSFMPDAEKEVEIKKVEEKRKDASITVDEWIWIDDNNGEELTMFLKKVERILNVLIVYDVTKYSINEEINESVFSDILDKMRVITP